MKLVRRLSDMGAAAIAFDVIFAEPDRMSPRNVIQEVEGVDPSLAAQLPDNDEIFAQSDRRKARRSRLRVFQRGQLHAAGKSRLCLYRRESAVGASAS